MGLQMRGRSGVVSVDQDVCVNCHACISVCPVKFCNDGSADHVQVHSAQCTGCGRCVEVCSHRAREAVDDVLFFRQALAHEEPMVLLVAPSVAVNFPGEWPRLIGWFRALGVEAVFDASFGAELTVMSYVDHLKKEKTECLISSSCPAVVSYISAFQPELLPYLAPFESPLLHTLKMVEKKFPQFRGHRMVAVTPCLAKKMEFAQSHRPILNVTMESLQQWIEHEQVDLSGFEASTFDQPPAEMGILFSSPGGLLKNMERHWPGIGDQARKIEGMETFHYLRKLSLALKKGVAPKVIDCLSCADGCNGGPGSCVGEQSLDALDHVLFSRYEAQLQQQLPSDASERRTILEPFWNPDWFRRDMNALDSGFKMKEPSEAERWQIYGSMLKESEADMLNCTSCGYQSCHDMASAIYNGLNRPENCHQFLQQKMQQEHAQALEAQQRFRSIFELSHDAVILGDRGGVLDCNQAACELFGMSRSAFRQVDPTFFFPEQQPDGRPSQEVAAEQMRKVRVGGAVSVDWLLRRGDGTTFHADVRVGLIKVGKEELLQVQVLDVTDRKRARQVLKESYLYIQALLETVECGILVIDEETHRLTDANPYALRLMKVARKEDVVGEPCQGFVCGVEHGKCPIYDLGKRVVMEECSVLDVQGHAVPVLKTVVRARLGGRYCLIESFVDISDKKETEHALKDARDAAEKSSQAKSEFLANMSHEIRTPMNGVLGMADLLMETPLSEEQKELAGNIHYSAECLLQVLNDILDFSRIEAGEMVLEKTPFSLEDSVRDAFLVLEPLAKARGNRLSVKYEVGMPRRFSGDPLRLRQVLLNLVGNAIKFTENGSIELEFRLERMDDGSGRFRFHASVRDTGVGIPADKLEAIFEKFSQADSSTTRRYGGTGLGLAITRQIIEVMGGQISVSSQLGRGTVFRFDVDLQPVEVFSPEYGRMQAEESAEADFSHVNVLLVEDNRVNQIVLTKQLKKLRCPYALAENGQDALQLLREKEFDLVLMDCSMPVMDGYEAVRRIRNELGLRKLPVIAVTAHAMSGDDSRCFEAGMDGYLSKPIRRGALLEMLEGRFASSSRCRLEHES